MRACLNFRNRCRKSWFSFDHFFSDNAFPLVLPKVYKNGIKKLLDVGGNTGKWAIASAAFSPDIHITIMDLPGQLNVAKKKVTDLGLSDRISFSPVNILDETVKFPGGYDAVWMSQFLDCFSEAEIISILRRCHDAISDEGCVYILEPFWDKQRFEIAAFCLHQTLFVFYSTGKWQQPDVQCRNFFWPVVHEAGFDIAEQTDNIGLSQTLLKCKKRK